MNQLTPSGSLRLENQVAVVTGGARGMGAGIVRYFGAYLEGRSTRSVVREPFGVERSVRVQAFTCSRSLTT